MHLGHLEPCPVGTDPPSATEAPGSLLWLQQAPQHLWASSLSSVNKGLGQDSLWGLCIFPTRGGGGEGEAGMVATVPDGAGRVGELPGECVPWGQRPHAGAGGLLYSS